MQKVIKVWNEKASDRCKLFEEEDMEEENLRLLGYYAQELTELAERVAVLEGILENIKYEASKM